MTPDEMGPDRTEGELGPEDEEAVRRLLADAAGARRMPDHVAARLDDVLAGLEAGRGTGSSEGPRPAAGVTDLSERRARRWPKLLVAAAAVSVIGVGLGNIVQGGGGDSMSATTSTDDSNAEAGAASGGSEDAVSPRAAEERAPSQASDGELGAARLFGANARTSALPQVRPGSASGDAQLIYDQTLLGPASAPRGTDVTEIDGRACDLPAVRPGDELVAVRLDGERATLLFRAVEDGRREAVVYACDDGGSPVLVTTVDGR